MQRIFSAQNRYETWRRLWIALAESEQEMGLPITDAQLAQMRGKVSDIDFARVAEIEKQTRHDVMAHIRAYGEVCPLKPRGSSTSARRAAMSPTTRI